MATYTHFHEHHEEEHFPFSVRSRVNWGPILGGVATAFAVYMLMALFGSAIGWSAFDPGEGLDTWSAAWSTFTIVVALFVGGWVCSRCTVGEDRTEGFLYGAILWGTMFVLLLFLTGIGVGLGFNALIGMTLADATTQHITIAQGETAAEAVSDTATWVAWWSFVGVLLSMIAAIGGAMAGPHRHHHHHHVDVATTHTTVPPAVGPMGTPRAT